MRAREGVPDLEVGLEVLRWPRALSEALEEQDCHTTRCDAYRKSCRVCVMLTQEKREGDTHGKTVDSPCTAEFAEPNGAIGDVQVARGVERLKDAHVECCDVFHHERNARMRGRKMITPTMSAVAEAKKTAAAARSLILPICGSGSAWNLSHSSSSAVLKASAESTKPMRNMITIHSIGES